MKKISITKEVLYDLYIIQQLTSKQVAEKLGTSASTVRNKLKAFDITPEMQKKHNEIKLTDLQHDVLIGSVLGDGSFERKSENSNTYLKVSHAKNQKEYCESKLKILQSLVNQTSTTEKDRSNDKDGKKDKTNIILLVDLYRV